MTNDQLSIRAIAKLDLALAYLGCENDPLTKKSPMDIRDAKQATTEALAALVELTNRLNGNQPAK